MTESQELDRGRWFVLLINLNIRRQCGVLRRGCLITGILCPLLCHAFRLPIAFPSPQAVSFLLYPFLPPSFLEIHPFIYLLKTLAWEPTNRKVSTLSLTPLGLCSVSRTQSGLCRFRFTVDLRPVNRFTVNRQFPIPNIELELTKMPNATILATSNFSHGYWHLPL